MRTLPRLLAAVTVALVSAAPVPAAQAAPVISTAPVVVPMVFPVVGRVSYSDTFLACRSGCSRQHLGQDLMGSRMQPLVATFDGWVSSLRQESVPGEGNYFSITSDDGWSVNYIHVNNDRPGTDDGRGTPRYAFAPGLSRGDRVFAGQLLGWLGDSGNAEGTAPHLHFELRRGEPWSGTVHNAVHSLDRATRIAAPRTSGPHPDGTFVRTAAPGSPVYRVSGGAKRRVHPSVLTALGFAPERVVVATSNEVRWYRAGRPVPLPDGLAYRGPDGALWFVTGGRRHPVPDAAALARVGIRGARVRTADAASLAATPPAADPALPGLLHEGALLREAGSTTVWLVQDGVRRVVPDWYTVTRWGRSWLDVAAAPAGVFGPTYDPDDPSVLVSPGMPVGPTLRVPDGLQLLDSLNRRWIVTGGVKRRLPEDAAALYGWTKVASTRPPATALSRIPVGPALP